MLRAKPPPMGTSRENQGWNDTANRHSSLKFRLSNLAGHDTKMFAAELTVASTLYAVLPLAGQLIFQMVELMLQKFAIARTLRTLQLLPYASATQSKSLQFARAYCFFAGDPFLFCFDEGGLG